MKITLAVTTWNDKKIIRRFMEHHRPHVDEIVWADDASNDGTVELAQPYADKCIISPKREYCCEFYRQKLADLSSNDWVLMMDSDQFVDFAVIDKLRDIIDGAEKAGQNCYNFELITIAHKECGACPKDVWSQPKLVNRKNARWSIFPHTGLFDNKLNKQTGGTIVVGKMWHLMKECGVDHNQHMIDHMLRMYRWIDVSKYWVRTCKDPRFNAERECCIQVYKDLKIDILNADYQCSRDPKQLIWIEDDEELAEHLREIGVLWKK